MHSFPEPHAEGHLMTIRKRARWTVGICALVTAATVSSGMPAQAAASSSVWVDTGSPATRAGEALFNRSNGTHANKAWIDINDQTGDASSVRLHYKMSGSNRWNEAQADGGCGTSASINLRTGSFTIQYYVCVSTGTFTNKCSDTRSDHN
jgi:hypothetical protein